MACCSASCCCGVMEAMELIMLDTDMPGPIREWAGVMGAEDGDLELTRILAVYVDSGADTRAGGAS